MSWNLQYFLAPPTKTLRKFQLVEPKILETFGPNTKSPHLFFDILYDFYLETDFFFWQNLQNHLCFYFKFFKSFKNIQEIFTEVRTNVERERVGVKWYFLKIFTPNVYITTRILSRGIFNKIFNTRTHINEIKYTSSDRK